MITKNIFTICLLSSISIFSQEKNCRIQLENFNQKEKVFHFLKENFLKEDNTIYHTEAGTPINASNALKEYGKTYNLEKSEVQSENSDGETEEEKIMIGQLYRINRYTETDKAVCYGKLSFPTFQILASNTDQFVTLIAENRKINQKNFKDLLLVLQKKVPLKKEDSPKFIISTFDFGTYLIQFKEAKSSYRSESSVGVPGEIIEKKVDLEFVIINKSTTAKQLQWLKNQNN